MQDAKAKTRRPRLAATRDTSKISLGFAAAESARSRTSSDPFPSSVAVLNRRSIAVALHLSARVDVFAPARPIASPRVLSLS